jgi:hypothetical protein
VVRLVARDAILADMWDRIDRCSGLIDLSLANARLIEVAAILHLARVLLTEAFELSATAQWDSGTVQP